MTDESYMLRRQVKQLQEELESKDNRLNQYNPNSAETLKRKIGEIHKFTMKTHQYISNNQYRGQ